MKKKTSYTHTHTHTKKEIIKSPMIIFRKSSEQDERKREKVCSHDCKCVGKNMRNICCSKNSKNPLED